MKETITPTANQMKRLSNCPSTESTSDQSILMRTVIWIWRLLLLKNADHSAYYQVARNKRPCWPLVHVVLCLSLVGPILAAPFIVSQTAWAAPAHLAHQQSVTTHLIVHRPASTTYAHDDPKCPDVSGHTTPTPDAQGICTYTLNTGETTCVTNYTQLGSQCSATATQCVQGETPQLCDLLKPPTCPGGVPPKSSPQLCTLGDKSTIATGDCGKYVPSFFCDISNFFASIFDIIKVGFQILGALLKYDLPGWIACTLSAGTIPCPTVSGTPWTFDCPNASSGSGRIIIDAASNQTIYQAALAKSATLGKDDWLSGDVAFGTSNSGDGSYPSGHLSYTYAKDTLGREGVQKLFSLSQGLGILLIGPLFALAGFQILFASVRPGSEKAVANAMEVLGRVLLAAATVGLSYEVVTLLLSLLNIANEAVLQLHVELGYPQTNINGVGGVSFSVPGDTPQSFRGLVMPMELWGCVMDDFIGLMASRVANMIGSGIPIVGGILGMTGRITEIKNLIEDLGEFLLLIISVTIWGQAIARLILLNYYIILTPVAFAGWGLPGEAGKQLIKAWFKGLMQLLFMQTVQIFVLATMPSLMPDFGQMKFPTGGIPGSVLQRLLVQLPPIIAGLAAVGAPKVLMGMGPMSTVAKAGAIAGKAVAAAGLAISGMIKKR